MSRLFSGKLSNTKIRNLKMIILQRFDFCYYCELFCSTFKDHTCYTSTVYIPKRTARVAPIKMAAEYS